MTCGIYSIIHTASGRRYVGSGISVENRWSNHKATLNKSNHPNSYLQRAWIKYGSQAFEFVLIETCEKELLVEREQHWMNHYDVCNMRKGYNLQPTARSPLGSKHKPDTKKKMSQQAKIRNAQPEYNKLISERAKKQWQTGNLKHWVLTEEQKLKHLEGIRNSEKLKIARASSEMRKNQSVSAKRRWDKIKAAGLIDPVEMSRRAKLRYKKDL